MNAMEAHTAITSGWRPDTRVHCADCGSARPIGSEDQACPWCPPAVEESKFATAQRAELHLDLSDEALAELAAHSHAGVAK